MNSSLWGGPSGLPRVSFGISQASWRPSFFDENFNTQKYRKKLAMMPNMVQNGLPKPPKMEPWTSPRNDFFHIKGKLVFEHPSNGFGGFSRL